MKIEQGKYYLTADGNKVGPMYGFNYKWVKYMDGDDDPEWENDGRGIDGAPDLIAEWIDEPRPWKDLTPEEKGALLLAHHEGKDIQMYTSDHWYTVYPLWEDSTVYRIKPEPMQETVQVVLYGCAISAWGKEEEFEDTHCITFDLVDGEPDCGSIKMEKLI